MLVGLVTGFMAGAAKGLDDAAHRMGMPPLVTGLTGIVAEKADGLHQGLNVERSEVAATAVGPNIGERAMGWLKGRSEPEVHAPAGKLGGNAAKQEFLAMQTPDTSPFAASLAHIDHGSHGVGAAVKSAGIVASL
jgi:hypothetical protein